MSSVVAIWYHQVKNDRNEKITKHCFDGKIKFNWLKYPSKKDYFNSSWRVLLFLEVMPDKYNKCRLCCLALSSLSLSMLQFVFFSKKSWAAWASGERNRRALIGARALYWQTAWCRRSSTRHRQPTLSERTRRVEIGTYRKVFMQNVSTSLFSSPCKETWVDLLAVGLNHSMFHRINKNHQKNYACCSLLLLWPYLMISNDVGFCKQKEAAHLLRMFIRTLSLPSFLGQN